MFLVREERAFAAFCRTWAESQEAGGAAHFAAEATLHDSDADDLEALMQKWLWNEQAGFYFGECNMFTDHFPPPPLPVFAEGIAPERRDAFVSA